MKRHVLLLAMVCVGVLLAACQEKELPPVPHESIIGPQTRIAFRIDPKLAMPMLREVLPPGSPWLLEENLPHEATFTIGVDPAKNEAILKAHISPRRKAQILCKDLNALQLPLWLKGRLQTPLQASATGALTGEGRALTDSTLMAAIKVETKDSNVESIHFAEGHAIEIVVESTDGQALAVVPCLFPTIGTLVPGREDHATPTSAVIQTLLSGLLSIRRIQFTADFPGNDVAQLRINFWPRKSDYYADIALRGLPFNVQLWFPWIFGAVKDEELWSQLSDAAGRPLQREGEAAYYDITLHRLPVRINNLKRLAKSGLEDGVLELLSSSTNDGYARAAPISPTVNTGTASETRPAAP